MKLEGRDVSQDSFQTAKGFYLSLYSRFEYKYFPSPKQQSILNIVKAFQSVGYLLSQSDLSNNELRYIKKVLSQIREIKIEEVFEGAEIKTRGMLPILLNLEIIVNEMSKDLSDDFQAPDRNIISQIFKPFNRTQFNFRSVKFIFAFKMALIMLVWEVLTMLFNLPFTKWLFFVTVSMMVPFIDDLKYTARKTYSGNLFRDFYFCNCPDCHTIYSNIQKHGDYYYCCGHLSVCLRLENEGQVNPEYRNNINVCNDFSSLY